jgi:hypothetical protein
MQSGLLGTVSADQSHQTVFFLEQFCLLKADGSGTVFFFDPTSPPGSVTIKMAGKRFEEWGSCGHILFHRNRGLN